MKHLGARAWVKVKDKIGGDSPQSEIPVELHKTSTRYGRGEARKVGVSLRLRLRLRYVDRSRLSRFDDGRRREDRFKARGHGWYLSLDGLTRLCRDTIRLHRTLALATTTRHCDTV